MSVSRESSAASMAEAMSPRSPQAREARQHLLDLSPVPRRPSVSPAANNSESKSLEPQHESKAEPMEDDSKRESKQHATCRRVPDPDAPDFAQRAQQDL